MDSKSSNNNNSSSAKNNGKKASSLSSSQSSISKMNNVKQSNGSNSDQNPTQEPLIKKIPMNKIKVGQTKGPDLKGVKSKINSISNYNYKDSPEYQQVKTKRSLSSSSTTRLKLPSESDTQKPDLTKVTSRIGSLQNKDYKPSGGNVKIETKKIDFTTTKSRIGSMANIKHKPGGGDKKIFNEKIASTP